jgi:hypothetical protein
MTDAQLNKLLRQHEKELQQLMAAQEEERMIQHDSFKVMRLCHRNPGLCRISD